MEYASTIWDPHINVHSNKLEKIQRRAARWATSQYSHRTSVTSLMDQLKWQPLEDRRRIQRLAFLYKILHHKVAVPISSIDLVYNSRPARGKDTNQSRLQITRASILTSLGNPLVYRLLRTGTLCSNLPSQRLKALKHHSRAVFKIRSETCRTKAQFCENLYMIKKESLPDRPKFCRSMSAVRHLFWRLQEPAVRVQPVIVPNPSALCPTGPSDYHPDPDGTGRRTVSPDLWWPHFAALGHWSMYRYWPISASYSCGSRRRISLRERFLRTPTAGRCRPIAV